MRRPTLILLGVMVGALAGAPPATPAGAVRSAGAWAATRPLATSVLYQHTATLLPTGKVLVVAGFDATAAQLYDPVDDTWSRTGPLSRPPDAHSATLLQSGKVLVTSAAFVFGGVGFGELYDPDSGTWTPAGSHHVGRSHTATLLDDGKVLAVGGIVVGTAERPGHAVLATAELYDPAMNEWAPAAPMGTGRAEHSALSLEDGRVLVTGGRSEELGFSLNTAEVYDPAAGAWQLVPHVMTTGRAASTATLLSDGSVFLVGGTLVIEGTGRTQEVLGQRAVLSNTELYDPATGRWRRAAALNEARRSHVATRLSGGRLLVTGGADDSEDPSGRTFVSSSELYDPAERKWRPMARMPFVPMLHTATALVTEPCGNNCGKVLVVARTDGDESIGSLFTPPKESAEDATGGDGGSSIVVLAAVALSVVVLGAVAGELMRRKNQNQSNDAWEARSR